MIDINFYKAYRTANEIVTELGKDYVYTDCSGTVAPDATCVYTFEGADGLIVGCFVGRFFEKLGIELADMRQGGGDSNDLIDRMVGRGLIKIDERSRAFLKMAQVMQDKGVPYGIMLDCASDLSSDYSN